MSVFGNLEIGKTGLNAAQLGQTVTGHNIANVNTEGFARQRLEQSADVLKPDGLLQGVKIDGISRMHDNFNTEKVVDQASQLKDWDSRLNYLKALEPIYQDLEGKGVMESLDAFWTAWAGVATQPESLAERQNLVSASTRLTDNMSKLDIKLKDLQDNLSEQMRSQMNTLNGMTKRVAELNAQIFRMESLNSNANDLKNERENLLTSVSEIANVNWFYNKQNQIDIQFADGVPLVRGNSSYDLEPYTDLLNPSSSKIGYRLSGGKLINVSDQLKSGSLKGIVYTRDVVIEGQRQKLKELSIYLGKHVNRLHAPGTGIEKSYTELKSAVALPDNELNEPLAYLNSGRVSFTVLPNSKLKDGAELYIDVVGGVDSLPDIARKINEAAGKLNKNKEVEAEIPEVDDNGNPVLDDNGNQVKKKNTQFKADNVLQASITPDGELDIKAGPGNSFIFNGDDSYLLGRMGVNPFFLNIGDLANFKINPLFDQDPLAIGLGYDRNPGDNRIALKIHDLQHEKLMDNNRLTFDEYYRGIYTDVGLEIQNAEKNKTNHKNIYDQYVALKDSITGVNIDEEMANMVKYQRAYDASAKYISTVDKMTESLINI